MGAAHACAEDSISSLQRPHALDEVLASSGTDGPTAVQGDKHATEVLARRFKQRVQRRLAFALGTMLGLTAIVALLGIAIDGSASGGVRWRSLGGLHRASADTAELLQQGLDAYDGDDGGDDDDSDVSSVVRDDMLAAAPPGRGREQALSWVDWNEDDIEREEGNIKKRLIAIEQAYIAQPQRLNELKVALGKVVEYYGPTGKLREGVPEAIARVQAKLQAAENEIMQSERMRKLTADIAAIREGAHLFVETQTAKDDEQDKKLLWNKDSQKTFMGDTHEHFKTLNRQLRDDSRGISRYEEDVDGFAGSNRRAIEAGIRARAKELEAKGKELRIKFFGNGGKWMRGKTRGKARVNGIWDSIEDEANANVSTGLAGALSKWDAVVRRHAAIISNTSTVLDEFEPQMRSWNLNVTWRLGNLSQSIINFRLTDFNTNDSMALLNTSRQIRKQVDKLADDIDKLAERRAVALDPCLGIRETAQALQLLLNLLAAHAQSAEIQVVN